ncbi:PspC domain-containing protein [Sandarakinorhabdus sp.]|uniref:PspC domain-containing protein n=1 Tax=Sandarakinorhabdus sp. TaxID=1916663 RepID=UPI00286D7DAB|nr:PspC domain-containing protein [Sandarakinorhabdus sp.]
MAGTFLLDKRSGKIMGVCAGIANYFNLDAMWIRLAFVAAAVFGLGSPILIYLIIGLVANSNSAG